MEILSGNKPLPKPGIIILFGSGETSPTGRKVFEQVFRSLPPAPNLALLETPAGFEPNSSEVIGRVGNFFTHHFQNYSPKVEIIPARKRGIEMSPDNPTILAPMLNSDLIFMGPGSPSYAIRQLRHSLAWNYLLARHCHGAAIALASAATVAFSACALPVYEIYKVGEELHWIDGLDFFKLYGLKLVFIPHWNNHEGGTGLDTSRCFMGQERFVRLMELLPDEITIVGLDEKTALIIDPSTCGCHVVGLGKVTLLHTGHTHISPGSTNISKGDSITENGSDRDLVKIALDRDVHFHQYIDGQEFPINELGPFHDFHPEISLPADIWQAASLKSYPLDAHDKLVPPEEIIVLMRSRQDARNTGNWFLADNLRRQIEKLGWEISDTESGPICKKFP